MLILFKNTRKKSFIKFNDVCLHKHQSKKHITNAWVLSEKTMYLLHKNI